MPSEKLPAESGPDKTDEAALTGDFSETVIIHPDSSIEIPAIKSPDVTEFMSGPVTASSVTPVPVQTQMSRQQRLPRSSADTR
jgi:hypothetical protein